MVAINMLTRVASIASIAFATQLHAQSSRAAPTYAETVAWLQGVATDKFVERDRCIFSHAQALGESPLVTHFGRLLTAGYRVNEWANRIEISINCTKTAECVSTEGKEYMRSYFVFQHSRGVESSRVQNALRNLSILCGATAVDANTF
jgi:hypothetical protein